MLTIVQNRSGNIDRLNVATAHLQAAIAHINNEAQRWVPVAPGGDERAFEELQLIVRALSDVVDGLRSAPRAPAQHVA
jgi:hypothetical protein